MLWSKLIFNQYIVVYSFEKEKLFKMRILKTRTWC